MKKCCEFYPGMLNLPAMFQTQQQTNLGGGATDTSWVDFKSAMVKMESVSGIERMHSQRLDAITRNRLTARYIPGLTESDRVVVKGRTYNIRFINNIEFADRWMVLDLEGGVPQ